MSGRAQTAGSWSARRGELLEYFDRTAVDAWRRLTSDAPVSRIRATVRAGRDRMRATLIAALPADLSGRRLLDAGCGTGALARERAAAEPAAARVHFAVGDMLDPAWGIFDHAVAMDSLIHYRQEDVVAALATLTARTGTSVLFTVAPRTPALSVMHAVGKIFPRGNRSPAIVPLAPEHLATQLGHDPRLARFRPRRLARVNAGFYIAEAMELRAEMQA
jgi:magnesium-protoporphyrin O-methyltransferase